MTETATCTCHHYEDGSKSWRDHCPEHGREAIMTKLLPPGTRVRSVSHPELTGTIKGHEWTRPHEISPIPYCIGWDDSSAASKTLGMLFVYATIEGVEAIEDE